MVPGGDPSSSFLYVSRETMIPILQDWRRYGMQFLVIGHDGTDEHALARRMSAREAHIAMGNKMRDAGTMLYAVARLDDNGKMVGSVLVCEFNSRADLDEWLQEEPYMTGNVWQKVEVHPCKVGPSFVDLKPTAQLQPKR